MSIKIPDSTGLSKLQKLQLASNDSQHSIQHSQATKTVYLCYSPDAPFSEKRFVLECFRQMRNSWIDAWLDRDEYASIGLTDVNEFGLSTGVGTLESPMCLTARLDACERCALALIFLSDSLLSSSSSLTEIRLLSLRQQALDSRSSRSSHVHSQRLSSQTPVQKEKWGRLRAIGICAPNFSSHASDVESRFGLMFDSVLRPSNPDNPVESAAEVTAKLLSRLALFPDTDGLLRKYKLQPQNTLDADLPLAATSTGEERAALDRKCLFQWSVAELQTWLSGLREENRQLAGGEVRVQNGVEHEFYERNLEEAGVDGFLMLAMTESDLVDVACVDSVAARRRLVRAVLDRLDAEGRAPNSWPAVLAMAQAEVKKQVDLCVIHERDADSDDARLAASLTQAFERRGISCVRAEPGAAEKQLAAALSSRPSAPHIADFLRTALPRLVGARAVLVLLSERSSRSESVRLECALASWLRRPLLVLAVEAHVWGALRFAFRALIYDCPALNYNAAPFDAVVSSLVNLIRPPRRAPPAVHLDAHNASNANAARVRTFGRLFDPLRVRSDRPLSSALAKRPAILVCSHEELAPDAEVMRRLLAEQGYAVLPGAGPAGASAAASNQSSSTKPFFLTGLSVSAQGDSGLEVQASNSISTSPNEAPGLVIVLLSARFLESDRCIRVLKAASVARTPLVLVLCAQNVLPSSLGGTENHRANIQHHNMPTPDLGPGRSWQVSAKRPPSVPTQVRKILSNAYSQNCTVDFSRPPLRTQNLPRLLELVRVLTIKE